MGVATIGSSPSRGNPLDRLRAAHRSPRSHPLGALATLATLAACGPLRVHFDEGGGPDGDSAAPPALTASCDAPERWETRVQTVHFEAEERPCDWGEGGNLEPAEGRASARRAHTEPLLMPTDATLCDLSISPRGWSSGWGPPYDDQFVLLMAGAVVASSSAELVALLPSTDGLALYGWPSLAGGELDIWGVSPWCLGEDSTCVIPGGQGGDEFDIALSIPARIRLLGHVRQAVEPGLSLVVIGDDDEMSDCTWDALDVDVSWHVAPPDTGVE